MNKVFTFNNRFYYLILFLNTKLLLYLKIGMKHTLEKNSSHSKCYFPTEYVEFLYSHYGMYTTNILRFLTH